MGNRRRVTQNEKEKSPPEDSRDIPLESRSRSFSLFLSRSRQWSQRARALIPRREMTSAAINGN